MDKNILTTIWSKITKVSKKALFLTLKQKITAVLASATLEEARATININSGEFNIVFENWRYSFFSNHCLENNEDVCYDIFN